MVKSAVRVIRILELVGKRGDGCLHSEIADTLDIPRGSLTPLLIDLRELGYIDYDEKTRRYSLGAEVLTLSNAYLRHLNVVQIGEPILRDVFREIHEFTSLVIAKNAEVVKVCEYAVPDPLAYHLQVGEAGPMHATAGGKALLAFMSASLREHILSCIDFRRFTEHTIQSKDALVKELKAIKAGAIAYCREEYLEGMISMALPVFNAENQAVAAIGINTRSVRFTRAHERKVAEVLRAAALKLSARLGNRTHRTREFANAA
jgi:DNA-binding IclR family transcriptional regulator